MSLSAQVIHDTASWICLLLLLCGDIELHPGPRPKATRLPLSAPLGSAAQRLAPEEMRKRLKARDALRAWLAANGTDYDTFIHWDLGMAAVALAEYGRWLYDEGESRQTYVQTVLAVVDERRDWRGHVQQAWD
eukprot:652689-Heterocapsa_arctica.AAC.1